MKYGLKKEFGEIKKAYRKVNGVNITVAKMSFRTLEVLKVCPEIVNRYKYFNFGFFGESLNYVNMQQVAEFLGVSKIIVLDHHGRELL